MSSQDATNLLKSLEALAGAFADAAADPNKDPKKGQPLSVLVEILSAKDLPALDLNGKSDPYVETWYCDTSVGSSSFWGLHTREDLALNAETEKAEGMHKIHTTKVIKKSLNPVWEKESLTHKFTPESRTDQRVPRGLQFRVWDKDTLSKDDFIGLNSPEEDLEFYADGERHEIEMKLQGEGSWSLNRGILRIAITVTLDGERVCPGRIGKIRDFRDLCLTPQSAIRAILKKWLSTHAYHWEDKTEDPQPPASGPVADAFKAVEKLADDMGEDPLSSVHNFWPRLCALADPLLERVDPAYGTPATALQFFGEQLSALVWSAPKGASKQG